MSGHSINQVHGLYPLFISAPHQSFSPSLTSTSWHCRPQLESWGALFFPKVTTALWLSSSSPSQFWGGHGDLLAQFSLRLLSVLIAQPSWMGLQSQIQCSLPCNREVPHSWNAYQRTGWPPLETRPWLWLSCLLVRLPGVCQWLNPLPTQGTEGVIATSIFQHYSDLYTMSSIFGGRWAVSSMLRGYWPLWWWLTSSPELKRYLGGSIRVWQHLLPRNDLFYWVSYHVTIFPILQWWKGGGIFLQVCSPFVHCLTFFHVLAEVSLMHC